MTRMLSILAGASLLALAGAANAGEPVTLSGVQMDGVTAGGCRVCYTNTATAWADASARGKYTDTFTETYAEAIAGKSSTSSSTSEAYAAGRTYKHRH